jgi:hypothetical protein
VSDWWEVYDHLTPTRPSWSPSGAPTSTTSTSAPAPGSGHRIAHRPGPDVDGTEFQAGDRIVCLRNDRRLGVVNGTRATSPPSPPTTRWSLRCDDGRSVTLPAWYVDAGHVAHGYAITGHKAQGMTVDHTFVLGSDELYREWGYVALSRGRHSNHLYVHGATTRSPISTATASPRPQTHTRRSRHGWAAARPTRRSASPPPRNGVACTRWLERLLTEQSSWTVPAISRETRQHRRRVRAETDRFEQDLRQIDARMQQVAQRLATLPGMQQIADARRRLTELTATIDQHVAARLDEIVAAPPDHLLRSLGAPPADTVARVRWRAAAQVVETHRTRWGITDPTLPFGPAADDPVQRAATHRAIFSLRTRLGAPQQDLARTRGNGVSRGLAR